VDVVTVLVVALVLAAVVLLVTAPLRSRTEEAESEAAARVAELEAAKEAKYREIRDAEMDFRTGKLSEADHRGLDRQLRAEAMEILRELDEASARAQ
jgi:flagellar biosynthesis/type III secretory pathway M-ring protein FliF/YscJ